MARSRSLIKLSGTIGNQTHANTKKGERVSKARESSGPLPDHSPLKHNSSRTGFLNHTSSGINNAVKQYCGNFAASNLYQRSNKLFRKERLNNILLLLYQLRGMQVNQNYPLGRFSGTPEMSIRKNRTNIIVEMKVPNHKATKPTYANCYFYEVLLLCWNKKDEICPAQGLKTEWISYDEGRLEFDVKFNIPENCIDYLVCVRESLGHNNCELSEMRSQSMQVMLLGSFYPSRQKMLDEKIASEIIQYSRKAAQTNMDEHRVAPKKRA